MVILKEVIPRSLEQIKLKTPNKDHIYGAVITAQEYKKYGYPCKIFPEPTKEEIMNILFPS